MAPENIASIAINESESSLTISIPGKPNSTKTLKKKRFQLVCALISRGPTRPVTSEYLQRYLPEWKGNKIIKQTGKEASRVLDHLEDVGLVIAHRHGGKTKGPWSLTFDVYNALTAETEETAARLVTSWNYKGASQFSDVPLDDLVVWMATSANALLKLTSGAISESAQSLEQALANGFSGHEDLRAIIRVIETRVAPRLKKPVKRVSITQIAELSVFGIAVEARQLAAAAIASPEHEWPQYERDLETVIGMVVDRADTATLATMFSAFAILKRRQNDYVGALAHIREAVPLAVLSGDLTLLQAVAFNFGHIISKQEGENEEALQVLIGHAHTLIGLDVTMREQHRIGLDSAQAELTMAHIHLRRGEFPQTNEWLRKAKVLIDKSKQAQDVALYECIRGRLMAIEAKSASQRHAAIGVLVNSVQHFVDIGRTSDAMNIEREIEDWQAEWKK